MAVYPETPVPEFPIEIATRLRVLYTEFDTGIEFRRRKWRFPKRTIKLTYKTLTDTERNTLYNFLRDRSISYESFYMFDWIARSWRDEFVGYGDGTVTTFSLPGKEIDPNSLVVYVAGTATTNFTFSAGTGPNGEDQITFTTAPTAGALITCDFTGKLRLKVRVSEESINFVQNIPTYESLKIAFTEVR